MNLLKRFANFIFRINKQEIPFTVSDNELLVRGIVHPMYYSNTKKCVKREAFLPPPNKTDVSLLRHRYTNDNFCKFHFSKLKISDSQYCGIATFYNYHIAEIYKCLDDIDKIEVHIKGTPINEINQYIEHPPVYKKAKGLPMHADMVYEIPIVKGEPNTKHRKFANHLAKISKYFNDPTPETHFSWSGEKLNWTKE